jgi:Putative transposase
VVYAKRPFGGPEYVLHYLGRYTHRVAISNHRLVSFTDGKVTFRWRDSAHNNEQKPMTLPIDEFLRRFLLHLLPKGFVRIRNFGFLANRRRAVLLPLSFHSLGAAQEPRAEQAPLAQTTFGAALCVVDRWWSSKGSRLQKSNFVLRHWSSLQHDTALPSSNPSRASARFVPLRLSAEQISSFSVFNHAY